jgi:hypothetical protein
MSAQIRERLLLLFVFLLPLLVVKGYGVFMKVPTPQTANAGTTSNTVNTTIASDPKRTWSRHERDAGEHIALLDARQYGPSPLDHREPPPPGPPPSTQPTIIKQPGNMRLTRPLVKLQLIWASDRVNIALIDGKRYREGDPLKNTGWIVTEIDGLKRRVRLESEDGEQTEYIFIDPPPKP